MDSPTISKVAALAILMSELYLLTHPLFPRIVLAMHLLLGDLAAVRMKEVDGKFVSGSHDEYWLAMERMSSLAGGARRVKLGREGF